ncbi:GAF domain-containing serine/threonine-protein kinase [Arthrobacter sp. H14-L1]|uniref:GAF domain-containing serine/threonine-protein kinase n=1 Tax=Arthrobacter sp. H14-L1 TaxID=2996697 RepID=UPI00226F4778|nr:GAF domain-containing serine/threonine-protein kinase [Arthrobacter sp. H14-L1]MCY0905582.1 GAF domain-containing serine/threonine-protein kinase [Arthrobacter sp. H14-L1]
MQALTPGYLLSGRYRVANVIGRGGRSIVYRAVDELLEREVAVKVAHNEYEDVEQIRQHEKETKILAGLSHHALVTLLDAGADFSDPGNRRTYLVMELIRGANLRARGAQGPFSAAHMALIGHDLADGLSYVHHRGIVHRDIKPANILLVDYSGPDVRPRAKLTDFGVATLLDSHRIDDEGGTSGTPAYLSPEQAAGEIVGPPSDVYSLGLVLLEGLTGIMAYPGAPLESALARLLRDPQIPTGLAPVWAALLTAMLARDPAQRPDAREVSLTLRQEVITGSGRHRNSSALLPSDEEARMQAVRRYRILDTPADGAFDRITSLAARLFSVPVAIVSIVDHDRIWFKSHFGTDVDQISRDPGLCASAILQQKTWVVSDALADPHTLTNPLVAGEFGLQFYAGVPLQTVDGYNLGTLCVLDTKPRHFGEAQLRILQDLAAIVMNDLEMRLQSRHSRITRRETERN